MKRGMAHVLVLALLMATMSGCFTTKMRFANNTAPIGETHRAWQHTFLWGMVSPGQVNLDGYCGTAGIKKVKTQVGGLGLIINWVTLGLWTPVTVKVTCGQP